MDPQYQYTPQGAPQMQQPGNGIAVASMILGIVSLVLFFLWFLAPILALLAIIFGALGIGKAKKIGGKGKGMAIAGLVTGSIGLVVSIIIIVLAFIVVSKAKSYDRYGEIEAGHDTVALVAPQSN
jgi:hypothetical protein